MGHLSESEIERLLTARLTPWERQRVVRHLLAGCGVCSRNVIARAPGRLRAAAAAPRRGRSSRDPLRDRTIAAALDQDTRWRVDDRRLDRTLERLGGQGCDARTSPQLQALRGRPLVEDLLRRSWEVRFHDLQAMRGLAYQAVKAAESLPPDEHAPPARLDLPARAWTALANAFRVNEDYAEADAALARARGFLRRGSGDLHLLATIAPMEASLRSSQRRFAEGRELLAKAYRLNVKLGNHHLAGSVLISQGSLAGFEGDFQQAVSSYRRGLALVDPDREPQLVAIGLHGLITSLVECGQSREAGRLLLKSDLRRWLPSSNVRWAEGKLLAGLGQLKKGEGALTTVHAELRETGRSNAAALVGLDLIPILLQRGKHGRARAIARESYEVFRALGLRSDAAEAKSYLL